jgi:hypothetical protein
MIVAATKSNMKQRSFYMDDDTYGLIEAHAERIGASKGTALRIIVRQVLGGDHAEPAHPANDPRRKPVSWEDKGSSPAPFYEGDQPSTIALPPDNQETFPVPAKFRDRGGPPRPQHEDDDF